MTFVLVGNCAVCGANFELKDLLEKAHRCELSEEDLQEGKKLLAYDFVGLEEGEG